MQRTTAQTNFTASANWKSRRVTLPLLRATGIAPSQSALAKALYRSKMSPLVNAQVTANIHPATTTECKEKANNRRESCRNTARDLTDNGAHPAPYAILQRLAGAFPSVTLILSSTGARNP
jgi:hypothetical protein